MISNDPVFLISLNTILLAQVAFFIAYNRFMPKIPGLAKRVRGAKRGRVGLSVRVAWTAVCLCLKMRCVSVRIFIINIIIISCLLLSLLISFA